MNAPSPAGSSAPSARRGYRAKAFTTSMNCRATSSSASRSSSTRRDAASLDGTRFSRVGLPQMPPLCRGAGSRGVSLRPARNTTWSCPPQATATSTTTPARGRTNPRASADTSRCNVSTRLNRYRHSLPRKKPNMSWVCRATCGPSTCGHPRTLNTKRSRAHAPWPKSPGYRQCRKTGTASAAGLRPT